MVWAGISWRERTPLLFATNKINAVEYVRVFQDYCEPFIEDFYPNGAILQQDMPLCIPHLLQETTL